MTKERAKTIREAIDAYEDKEGLFGMAPEEAAKELGGDFAVEEIAEFGNALQSVASCVGADGEIDQAELEKVSGGRNGTEEVMWEALECLGTLAAVGVLVAGGIAVGFLMW